MIVVMSCVLFCFFFFKRKTAYEMRISDWSSDVCSSDLPRREEARRRCLTSLEEHVAVQIIAADRPVEPPPRIGDEPRFLDESLPDTVIEKIEGNRQTERPAKIDFEQPVLIPVA